MCSSAPRKFRVTGVLGIARGPVHSASRCPKECLWRGLCIGTTVLKTISPYSFVEGNVATFLAQFDESGAFQRADHALTGNTGKFWHVVTGRLLRWSRTSLYPQTVPRGRPRFRGIARWPR